MPVVASLQRFQVKKLWRELSSRASDSPASLAACGANLGVEAGLRVASNCWNTKLELKAQHNSAGCFPLEDYEAHRFFLLAFFGLLMIPVFCLGKRCDSA